MEAPANGSEEDLRKHIKNLEDQLDYAYARLSLMNGKGASVKRARRGTGVGSKDVEDPKPVDARIVAWELHQHVEALSDQVSEDFDDGYEEQWETKLEWYESLREPLQNVLDVGVGKRAALKECNDVLKMVADSFYALLACGSRMDTREELSESEASFELKLPWGGIQEIVTGEKVESAWAWVWIALLRTHAELNRKEDEKVLLQSIKDAHDHIHGGNISLAGPLSAHLDETYGELKDRPGVPDGTALAKIVKEKEFDWKKMPCNRRYHRPKTSAGASKHGEENDEEDDDDGNDYADEGDNFNDDEDGAKAKRSLADSYGNGENDNDDEEEDDDDGDEDDDDDDDDADDDDNADEFDEEGTPAQSSTALEDAGDGEFEGEGDY